MKTIGTVAGRRVTYGGGVVRVYGTEIMITGLKDEAHAIERCKANLRNFKEVQR